MMIVSIAGHVVNEALFGGLSILATTASRIEIAIPLPENHPWHGSQGILETSW
jgi:hypothetical protein